MMKDILRLGIILFLISALATGILAWVNSVTIDVITDRKAKEAIETRQQLMPEAKTFEEKKAAEDSTFVYYIGKNDKGEVIGYTFVAENRGYSSVIKTMVALSKDFKVVTLKVIDQNETPGLGTWCLDKNFPDRFKGLSVDGLKVDKDGGSIKSITGATITTRAITNSIHDAIQLLQADAPETQSAPQGQLMEKKPNKTIEMSQKLIPDAVTFEEKKAAKDKTFVYYIARNTKNEVLGYTFVTKKRGYCSVIRTLVALDTNLRIKHMRVLHQNETPGLGTLCAEPDFTKQFISKSLKELKIVNEGGKIEAITGATITSQAVASSIRESIILVKADLTPQSKDGAL
jgi:electron transport complex protein RnfG